MHTLSQGIYIHIPFCKQACHYCNFHFTTNTTNQNELVEAILKELSIRKQYLNGSIDSIYFGGGTPSLLSQRQIYDILSKIYSLYPFNNEPYNIENHIFKIAKKRSEGLVGEADQPIFQQVHKNIEITFEANPDDLSINKLKELYALGINRLSIGIQTFDDNVLKYINRAHDSKLAINAYYLAREIGFDNINIDLIFALPKSNIEILESDLKILNKLKPDHVSIYCLSIERNTYFNSLLTRGLLKKTDTKEEVSQLELIIKKLAEYGYLRYEVSNFCLNNKYSKHNSNYWKKGSYLGIGPSAHSYNGTSRQWNISNNKKYIESIKIDIVPYEKEELTNDNHLNEYILLTLRTIWGCDLDYIKEHFAYDLYAKNESYIKELIANEYLLFKKNNIQCTQKGLMVCDEIARVLCI